MHSHFLSQAIAVESKNMKRQPVRGAGIILYGRKIQLCICECSSRERIHIYEIKGRTKLNEGKEQ